MLKRLLASRRRRIFLIAWIVFSAHFATNVVREHYPAFSLAERGTFRVDPYQGFHSDIFVHTDGHSYVNNNVAVSVVAAVPLLAFDPVLDALERHSKRKLAATGSTPFTEYRTEKPNRVAFFARVRESGLDLRFGAATAITSVLLMAPLTALIVVLMYQVLLWRGAARGAATWLTFLFAFGTPIFFRQAHLSHNMFLMYATFGAFVLLWRPSGGQGAVPTSHRVAAGFLGGFTLAADYMGVITLVFLFGYLLFARLSSTSWAQSFRESLAYVAGSVGPIAFLLYSQWAMFGNALLPAQSWMTTRNMYVDEGWHGFDWPSLDMLAKNLFDPGFGLYAFCPLLLLALLPGSVYPERERILPRCERRFVAALFLALLLFCAANQFARLQWNTGFRYLIPLVPLLFLAASDHLVRLPRWLKVALTVGSVVHAWVLTVFRESLFVSWSLFLDEGIQLPWLRVLKLASPPDAALIASPLLPAALLAATLLLVLGIWRLGAKGEAGRG